MTGTLIRKELHQHWWAFVLISVLSILGVAWILFLTVLQGQGGSHLIALRLHAFILAFSSLILGNRLVVAEYGSHTQLFLETLPLPRGRIVLVKYFLGLVVILLCAAGCLAIAMLAGARTEVFTPRFVGILNARYLCYAFFVYSFFFGMGFLGRYRFIGYALIILGVALLTRTRDLEMAEIAPIHLVGSTFPFEREVFPVESLAITGGLGLAFFLLSIALAVTREGSVSSLLGERMSYRDKITLAALSFGILAALYVVDEQKIKEPYQMGGGTRAEGTDLAEVTVSPESPAAAQLANRIAGDLDAMAEYLGLESMPPVFLIERPDLDPDQFEYGWIENAEGIILRTAYRDPEWSYEKCLEHLAGDIVESASRRRAMKEDRFWVIDGFTLYWPHRGNANAPLDEDRHLLLRALYGTEILGGIDSPRDLKPWFAHQRTIGHNITAGIGWSMLRALEREAGPEATQAFLRSILVLDGNPNVLTTIRDLRDPVPARFRRHTGLELDAFLDTWNAELDRWREPLADSVAAIPRLSGEIQFEGEPGASSQVRYRYTPPESAGPDVFERPVLLYGETAPFTVWLPEELTRRMPLSVDEPSERFLRETWGSGTGFAWTFAAHSPALRCRIISGWQHTHVP